MVKRMANTASATAQPTVPPGNLGRTWLARVFSFPVMCVVLLAAAIFAYAPRGIGVAEPDIFWRLRGATDVLQSHSLSLPEMHSFTLAGTPTTNYEWLSDLLFLFSYKAMGLRGMVILYALSMVVIFAVVYYRACKSGADCKDAAVATLGGICIGVVSLAPRPLLFGWVCLSGVLVVLDRFRESRKGLWLLPPLFLLWINLHGSWIYGIAIVVLTIVSGLIAGRWGVVVATRWSPEDLRKLLVALVASLAALFVNPFGYKLVLFPFAFFRMQGFMQYVEYWHSVDFGTYTGKLALALIFGLIAAALFSRRRWRLDEVLLMAFALWSGLSHVRFLDFTALIIVPILAPRLKLFPAYQPELDKPWLNAIVILAVIAGVIVFLPTQAQLQERVDSELPAAALTFMQQSNINGRIFSPAEFGGFIEWDAPQFQSFVDGRPLFVERGIFEDSFSALTISDPYAVLDKYKIDYVLIEPTWPLAYLLKHTPSWRVLYSDKVAVLFQRVPVS